MCDLHGRNESSSVVDGTVARITSVWSCRAPAPSVALYFYFFFIHKLAVKENMLLNARARANTRVFLGEKMPMFCTCVVVFTLTMSSFAQAFYNRERNMWAIPIKRIACTLSIYTYIYMIYIHVYESSIYIAPLKEKSVRYFWIERQAYSEGLRKYFTTKV